MRRVLGALIFLVLPAVLLAAEPIKVVSWNLEWFPGGEPKAKPATQKKHMEVAKSALWQLDPDILCLQEVRDEKAVQEVVSGLPGLKVAIVSQFEGQQQQAIVSSLPVDSAWYEEWKAGEAVDPPRGYAFAAFKLSDGSILLVYSLHMKANSGRNEAGNIAKREESSRQLLAHVVEMQKLYGQRGKVGIILAGDWNTTLDDDPRFAAETTIRSLLVVGFHSTWEGVPFEQRITHPGEGQYPAITFDHILTYGLGNPVAKVVSEKGVSDHEPVVLSVTGVVDATTITVPSPTPEPTAGPTLESAVGASPTPEMIIQQTITIQPPM